jgi:hypothetical protein
MDLAAIAVSQVHWPAAVRIVRSIFPPIDLFEDIADPADWPLLIAAEQKTNPRLMLAIGRLDMVPAARRVSGAGASYLMAPFTHASRDRPSRFSDGSFGVLYVADSFETALFETIHHHALFMAKTREAPGWTSQFREIVLEVRADLHDIRNAGPDYTAITDPDDYTQGQFVAGALHRGGSDGIAYPSVRNPNGECAALFYPDLAHNPVQGRHLDYHWDGDKVDLIRDASRHAVYRVVKKSA